ncbi:hypothetical protein NQ317_007542, partial [Molorchus minor]
MNFIWLFVAVLAPASFTNSAEIRRTFTENKIVNDGIEIQHHPDFGLDISQFLEKYGYPLESYEITTEDGYILTVHRIPHGKDGSQKTEDLDRPPILLMHPLVCSSIDMVNLGPDKSIGLLLADEGYDVWLGNVRGNAWSRRHISLDPDGDAAFWNFTFDDIGLYDIPATIDLILNTTGREQLSYLGHSQGTAQFFVMNTLKPEYNRKVNVMVAFAPIAYMKNITQPLIRWLADNMDLVYGVLADLNINELLPYNDFLTNLVHSFCCDGCGLQELCGDFIGFLVGFDRDQLDGSFIEVMASNAPTGTSTKNIKQFGQLINSGVFGRFDYGILGNLEIYGQLSPPEYDLSLITVPVALYYGGNDTLSLPHKKLFIFNLPKWKNTENNCKALEGQVPSLLLLWTPKR